MLLRYRVMERIPVSGPWITDREISYAAQAAETGWYKTAGDFPRAFEEAFARYAGRRHAISLPSCTSAIHLSLAALGVGSGDEVIVPDATWIASAAPVSYLGATPVFADIDEDDWCLSPRSVEKMITSRTRGIIAVDLYGGMPDMDALLQLAKDRDLFVIEDAAEAVGSRFKERPAGSFGTTSVFSFHGSKTLTTGEGGMVLVDDDAVFERMLVLRDHGRNPGDSWFFNSEVGFKYKMSALQAALGLAQLERIDDLVAKKREIFAWYAQRFAQDERFVLNPEPEHTFNSYWMPTVLVDRSLQVDKEALMRSLLEKGVDSRPFFHPLSSIPAYAGHPQRKSARETNPVSYDVSARGLNLPSPLILTEEQADYAWGAVTQSVDELGPATR